MQGNVMQTLLRVVCWSGVNMKNHLEVNCWYIHFLGRMGLMGFRVLLVQKEQKENLDSKAHQGHYWTPQIRPLWGRSFYWWVWMKYHNIIISLYYSLVEPCDVCCLCILFRCENASDHGSVRFISGFLQVVTECFVINSK